MAGSMALTLVDERLIPLKETTMQWEIRYSRFIGYLPSTSSLSSLSPLPRNKFRGTWLSSASPTAILSLSADHSASAFILTVSFDGKILEQHYASKLHFSWPQLSCMSNIPEQSTQVVLVSYKDGASETQKFGLRFSSYNEVGDFVAMLENIFYNEQHYSEDFMTTRSSHSEGKDALSEVIPTGAFPLLEGHIPNNTDCYVPHTSQDSPPVLPPRFTALVTNCSDMAQPQGNVIASTPTAALEVDIQSLIVKYLQDGSFLDILTKAEEVIAEMGGGMTIQQFV